MEKILFYYFTLYFMANTVNGVINLREVQRCPMNETEWTSASAELGCRRENYYCVPYVKLTGLLEFCHTQLPFGMGLCIVLNTYNTTPTSFNCSSLFKRGCPGEFHRSSTLFRYLDCLKINRKQQCFLADPSCNRIESTVEVENTRFPLNDNGSIVANTTSKDMPKMPQEERNEIYIVTTLSIIIVILIGFIVWQNRRKGNRCKSYGLPKHAEDDSNIIGKRWIRMGSRRQTSSFTSNGIDNHDIKYKRHYSKDDDLDNKDGKCGFTEDSEPDNRREGGVRVNAEVWDMSKKTTFLKDRLRKRLLTKLKSADLEEMKHLWEAWIPRERVEEIKTMEILFNLLEEDYFIFNINLHFLLCILHEMYNVEEDGEGQKLFNECVSYGEVLKEYNQPVKFFRFEYGKESGFTEVLIHVKNIEITQKEKLDIEDLISTILEVEENKYKLKWMTTGVTPSNSVIVTLLMKTNDAETLLKADRRLLCKLCKFDVDYIQINETKISLEDATGSSSTSIVDTNSLNSSSSQSLIEQHCERWNEFLKEPEPKVIKADEQDNTQVKITEEGEKQDNGFQTGTETANGENGTLREDLQKDTKHECHMETSDTTIQDP